MAGLMLGRALWIFCAHVALSPTVGIGTKCSIKILLLMRAKDSAQK